MRAGGFTNVAAFKRGGIPNSQLLDSLQRVFLPMTFQPCFACRSAEHAFLSKH